MNRTLLLYMLWCLLIGGGFVMAARSGYSPFADGRRATGAGVGGVYGRVGPTHK